MNDPGTNLLKPHASFESLPGAAEFLHLVREREGAARGVFDSCSLARPVTVARAPGRLDVMGGIADYSGALVLQWPIREAALVAAQPGNRAGSSIRVVSDSGLDGSARAFCMSHSTFQALAACDYLEARDYFAADPDRHWAAYIVGVLLVLAHEREWSSDTGWNILVRSNVPEGKGVSSSAAIEVATMQAVTHALGQPLDGVELATLCQRAENLVVGAPCGIMDQMASALGEEDRLLALLCQPARVQGTRAHPPELAFWGIDSGIRHAVTGNDYIAVRTAAFMGYRILADLAGLKHAPESTPGAPVIEDDRWHGYLANIDPEEFEAEFLDQLPVQCAGPDFRAQYGRTTDTVTRVRSAGVYPVRAATAHPVHEHARVRRFDELLATGKSDARTCRELGALMYASHESYSSCGLGSEGTDLLVRLVREAGEGRGLYGAKITGGGSGGTVAILGRSNAGPAVAEIAEKYAAETGREPYLFEGSSPGACRAGTCTISALPSRNEVDR